MIPLLAGAATAALLGGPHCVGMCGPFVSATGPWWHAGRMFTYATLGALAGSAGMASFLVDSTASAIVSGVLLVAFAARMAGLVEGPAIHAPWLLRAGSDLLRRGGPLGHFGFGVVSGLLPCGLVWSALALSVSAASVAGGAAVMAVFWVGTLPALSVAAVALRRLAGAHPWVRRGVAGAVLAAGLVSIGMRAQLRADAPSCHEAAP